MKSTLFVADSVLTLADGKNIAIGLYTDRVLQMAVDIGAPDPTVESPYGVNSLSFIFTIIGMAPGEYLYQLAVAYSDGASYPGVFPPRKLRVSQSGSANIIVNFTPFLVTVFGAVKVTVSIAGQTPFEQTFEIRRGTHEQAEELRKLQAAG